MHDGSKIRIALVYKPSAPQLSGASHDYTLKNLFWGAMRRNPDVQMSYHPSEDAFDVSRLRGKTDVILIGEELPHWVPDLKGIRDLGIPVVCKCADPHKAELYPLEEYREKFKITQYWGDYDPEYFYKFYPRDCPYEKIYFGLEPHMFEDMSPFESRIKDRILNTGAVALGTSDKSPKSVKGLVIKIDNMHLNGILRRTWRKTILRQTRDWRFYKLRTMCNYLPYVTDHTVGTPGFKRMAASPGGFYSTLSRYRASIAAMTAYATRKYFEIPAAGCLAFMEVTEKNRAARTGFLDMQTAVFINEKNYRERFKEYLESPDDTQWAEIAAAGRRHALDTASNDIAVAKLVRILQRLV